ncbi:hypothetical protein [Nonomuraea lactucae]|uniref:hypothetical protein n=1 Tax=Nonomuraea lactucae TaxID=2249762 RepID=UPI000DE47228|nr:hypothetical protein [Nonomuraea lactucae]
MGDELRLPSQRREQGDDMPNDHDRAGDADDLRVVEETREDAPVDDTPVQASQASQAPQAPQAPQGAQAAEGDVLVHGSGHEGEGDPHARDYKDPYGAPGDMPVVETGETGGVPSHAAPQAATVLFDRDPAEVQARWRDLQAAFVDDPGEAVKRADGLVGEVVESLTAALSAHTGELRGRWESVGESDTEQLRLALREYRSVLERLLTLSGPGTR